MLPIPFNGGGRGGFATIMIASAVWLLAMGGFFAPKRQAYVEARIGQLTRALEAVQGRPRRPQRPKRPKGRTLGRQYRG